MQPSMEKRLGEMSRKQWANLVAKIKQERGSRCESCGKEGRVFADHIIAVWKYGTKYDATDMKGRGIAMSDPQNIQLLCKDCNDDKDSTDTKGWWDSEYGEKMKLSDGMKSFGKRGSEIMWSKHRDKMLKARKGHMKKMMSVPGFRQRLEYRARITLYHNARCVQSMKRMCPKMTNREIGELIDMHPKQVGKYFNLNTETLYKNAIDGV